MDLLERRGGGVKTVIGVLGHDCCGMRVSGSGVLEVGGVLWWRKKDAERV